MNLTADEFRDVLAKGRGRAAQHIRGSSADVVREVLLDACLQCKTYVHSAKVPEPIGCFN